MRYLLAPLIALALASPAAAQPAAVSLDDAVRGIEGAYGKMNDLKGEFTQTAFNKSLNQTIPATGVVYLKKVGTRKVPYAKLTMRRMHPYPEYEGDLEGETTETIRWKKGR